MKVHEWSDQVLDWFSRGKGGCAERCYCDTTGKTAAHHCRPGSSIYDHMARRPPGTKKRHKKSAQM